MAGTELAAWRASADGTVERDDRGHRGRAGHRRACRRRRTGCYYQAWARSPDGELVSMGTFHMRGGDATVTLWSAVDRRRTSRS